MSTRSQEISKAAAFAEGCRAVYSGSACAIADSALAAEWREGFEFALAVRERRL